MFNGIRGALVVPVVWAVTWTVAGSLLMEGVLDRHGAIVDIWPTVLFLLGLVAGAVFYVAITLTTRGDIGTLSSARAGIVGALSVLPLAGFAYATGLAASAVASTVVRVALIFGLALLFGILAASATLMLARKAAQRGLAGAR